MKNASLIWASLCLTIVAACAPAQDDPRRSLEYKEPVTSQPGISPSDVNSRVIRGGRTNTASNKFGRSRNVVRSNSRFGRGRIGR